MTTTRELRSYRQVPVPELRSTDDGNVSLGGYAAVFNRYSQNLGGFVEEIKPGAFDCVLSRAEHTVALYNHDPNKLLGTFASRTLLLEADDVGLRYEVPLDMSDPDAVSVAAKAKLGKLRGSSFSFSTSRDAVDWLQTDQGFPLRSIRSFDSLYDVGPVTFPAYRATEEQDLSVSLRSLADATGVDMATLIEAARSNELASHIVVVQGEDASGVDPTVDDDTPTSPIEEQHSLRSASVRRWTATRSTR